MKELSIEELKYKLIKLREEKKSLQLKIVVKLKE